MHLLDGVPRKVPSAPPQKAGFKLVTFPRGNYPQFENHWSEGHQKNKISSRLYDLGQVTESTF